MKVNPEKYFRRSKTGIYFYLYIEYIVVLAHLVICKYNGVILKLVAQCGMLCLFYNYSISVHLYIYNIYILFLFLTDTTTLCDKEEDIHQ